MNEAAPQSPPRTSVWKKLAPRAEDWLLLAFLALIAPLFGHGDDSLRLDARDPLEAVLRVLAVLGTIAGLAARPAEKADQRFVVDGAFIGPLTGGILLIAITGVAALGGAAKGVGLGLIIAAIVIVVLERTVVPPLSTNVRRLLVMPFILFAGALFWSVIDGVSSDSENTPLVLPVIGFFVAFSAVYYAMLIYAPRQVVEREGGPIEWLVRYGLFVAGVLGGLGWSRALGT